MKNFPLQREPLDRVRFRSSHHIHRARPRVRFGRRRHVRRQSREGGEARRGGRPARPHRGRRHRARDEDGGPANIQRRPAPDPPRAPRLWSVPVRVRLYRVRGDLPAAVPRGHGALETERAQDVAHERGDVPPHVRGDVLRRARGARVRGPVRVVPSRGDRGHAQRMRDIARVHDVGPARDALGRAGSDARVRRRVAVRPVLDTPHALARGVAVRRHLGALRVLRELLPRLRGDEL